MCLTFDANAARKYQGPPSPAAWYNVARSQPHTHNHVLEPKDVFIAAVNSSIHATIPLESSSPTGCWLSGLIDMQVVRSAEIFDYLALRFQYKYGDDLDEQLTKLSLICSSLESNRREIIGIQERTPNIRRSDYALAFSRLEQLLEEVKGVKREIDELLSNQFRIKSIYAAESTVREGRSAVARESRNRSRNFGQDTSWGTLTGTTRSDRPSLHLHTDEPGFVDLRHERAGNQHHGPQHMDFHLHISRAVGSLRPRLLLPASHESFLRRQGGSVRQRRVGSALLSSAVTLWHSLEGGRGVLSTLY